MVKLKEKYEVWKDSVPVLVNIDDHETAIIAAVVIEGEVRTPQAKLDLHHENIFG